MDDTRNLDRPKPGFVDEDSNRSGNTHFHEVLAVNQQRRQILQGTLGMAIAGLLVGRGANAAQLFAPYDEFASGLLAKGIALPLPPRPAYAAVAVNRADTITVPPGYTARAAFRWGEPITGTFPAYLDGGRNTGADQEQQLGQNHDGMAYFPFPDSRDRHGLLAMNHEYIDQATLLPNGQVVDGAGSRLADDVRKEIAAHGVSVIEVAESAGTWNIVRGNHNRRITGATPMEITGPARGSAKLVTAYSSTGTATRGTLNNCANGQTPWGTYLTCEENWSGYFVNRDATRPREHTRYGVPNTTGRYLWETVEARFNASTIGTNAVADFRNEPNTFGWIVEIDPYDPKSTPKKRTALGRFGHEGCVAAPPLVGQPYVFYMGDDATREYVYKFVSKAVHVPHAIRSDVLDEGTLYAARFNADGTGDWLPLDLANAAFRAAAAAANVTFADQADVLINTRLAADVVGATPMDRPEWTAVSPVDRSVYVTLTNNTGRTAAQIDAPNPRAPNPNGHVLRWNEENGRPGATRFNWSLFMLSGPQADSRTPLGAQPLNDASIHASPDGLWFDAAGLLWIQTDMSGSQLASGPFGNNAMLTVDPQTGDIRRFLVGPVGCEVTGITSTPDLRTVFINIQHPGETGTSNWPDGGTARPRSATVVITRDSGGLVGT